MTIQLTRIYTRRGDDGWTALTDGTRVAKSDQRLAPDIEELNAHLGLALSVGGLSERQNAVLAEVQNDLFDVGADLVSPPSESGHSGPLASPAYTQKLEAACDEANAALAPLDSFVVPGGSVLAAQLHVCRTVCRRIERAAAAVDGINPEALRYLNRLSDLLFIFARVAGQDNERLWEPGAGR